MRFFTLDDPRMQGVIKAAITLLLHRNGGSLTVQAEELSEFPNESKLVIVFWDGRTELRIMSEAEYAEWYRANVANEG